MLNIMWGAYLLLGLSAVFSWLSMGLLSLLSLIVLLFWLLSIKAPTASLYATHAQWLKNSVYLAVFLHLLVVFIEGYEFYHVLNHFSEDVSLQSFVRFIANHWLLDYLAEIVIAILLTFRTIKGTTRLLDKRTVP